LQISFSKSQKIQKVLLKILMSKSKKLKKYELNTSKEKIKRFFIKLIKLIISLPLLGLPLLNNKYQCFFNSSYENLIDLLNKIISQKSVFQKKMVGKNNRAIQQSKIAITLINETIKKHNEFQKNLRFNHENKNNKSIS
jgi:hypothetical protein